MKHIELYVIFLKIEIVLKERNSISL